VKVPPDWPLLVLVGLLVGLAVYAGPNVYAAIALGVAATLLAGMLFAVPMMRMRRGPSIRAATPAPPVPLSVVDGFRGRTGGRAEVVHVLDALERTGPHPNLRPASVEQLERVRAFTREQFRAYVRYRLSVIEAGSP
jgi:hypothetical protein